MKPETNPRCFLRVVGGLLATVSFDPDRAVAGDPFSVGINGAPCAYTTIAQAVAEAPDGATILVRPGLYFQKIGEISGKKLQIRPSDPSVTFTPCTEALEPAALDTLILDGAGGGDDSVGGLVEVTDGAVVEFRNMTLRNATAGKGGILAVTGDESAVVLHNAMLQHGRATDLGGGAYVGPTGFLRMEAGSRVEASEADPGSGGGIALEGATLEITDGSIGEQSVSLNGDIGVLPAPNFARGHGGGVFALDSQVLLLSEDARILANVAVLAGGGIHATSSTVTSTDAVIDANEAGTRGGGIYVTGEDASLTMDGGSVRANETTASIGSDGGGGICVEGPVSMNLEGVSVTGNSSAFLGGGIVGRDGAMIELLDSTIGDSKSEGPGGGIFVTGEATSLAVVNTIVSGNEAGNVGGGIYSQFASVWLSAADVSSNTAPEGGGLYLDGVELEVSNSYVHENATTGDGAALRMQGGSAVIVDGYFVDNEAGGDAGALFADGTSITATRLFVTGNTAATRGGGILLTGEGTSLSVDDGAITGNVLATADQGSGGAGLYAGGDVDVLLEGVMVGENVSPNHGGGILATGGANVTVAGASTVQDNAAAIAGGGIYASQPETQLVVAGSAVRGNSAGSNGGGLYVTSAPLTITGSTIEGNDAPRGGGAVLRHHVATLTNVHVKGNTATDTGGGLLIEGAQVTMNSDFSSCAPSSLPADSYCSEVRGNHADGAGGGVRQGGSTSGSPSPVYPSSLSADSVSFHGNTSDGPGAAIFVGRFVGVMFQSVPSTTLVNALVRSNPGSTAVEFEGPGQLTIAASTFVENLGHPLYVADDASSVVLESSLFFDNAEGPFVGVGVTFERSCNGSQPEAVGSLDFFASDANPKFTTTERGAFRLDVASPFVDACDEGPSHDLDGVARPRAAGFDAGAFEFVSPASSTTTTTLPVADCGDVNADGDVTAADALAALRAAVGAIACAVCICDADGSGGVFAADALRLLQAAVGLDVQLECGSCT